METVANDNIPTNDPLNLTPEVLPQVEPIRLRIGIGIEGTDHEDNIFILDDPVCGD